MLYILIWIWVTQVMHLQQFIKLHPDLLSENYISIYKIKYKQLVTHTLS